MTNPAPADLSAELLATSRSLSAVTGRPARVVGAGEALAALRAGATGAIAVVPWHQTVGARAYPTNQLVLRAIAGDRLHFDSPLAAPTPAAAGSALGGLDQGPMRRREADGSESMAIATFKQLVALGGRVVLPATGSPSAK